MPIPNVGAVPDVVTNTLIATDWGNAIGAASRGRVVQRFNTTAERDASITAPVTGMLCYVLATDQFYGFTAAAGWTSLIGGPRDTAHSRVYRAGAYTLGTAAAAFPFDTPLDDALGMYNVGTSKWTVPAAGSYLVTSKLRVASPSSANYAAVFVYKNGAAYVEGSTPVVPGANYIHPVVAVTVKCALNDTLSIWAAGSVAMVGSTGMAQSWATLDYLGAG